MFSHFWIWRHWKKKLFPSTTGLALLTSNLNCLINEHARLAFLDFFLPYFQYLCNKWKKNLPSILVYSGLFVYLGVQSIKLTLRWFKQFEFDGRILKLTPQASIRTTVLYYTVLWVIVWSDNSFLLKNSFNLINLYDLKLKLS